MEKKLKNQAITKLMMVIAIGVLLVCGGCGNESKTTEPTASTTTIPKPTQVEEPTPTPLIVEPTLEAKLGEQVYEKALASLMAFEDYRNEGDEYFPIFGGDFLESYGIYENPIKIANEGNKTEVILDEHLNLPESYVVSLVAGEQVEEVEKVTDFLRALQELEIKQEAKYVNPGDQESPPYLSMGILLLNEDEQFISIYIESYMDGTLHFTIIQEGQKELFVTATAKEFKERIRDLYRLKTVTMEEIKGITELKYLDDTKMWITVSEEDMEIFISLLDGARQMPYGRDGCPWENQLRATLQDGEEIVIFCASDSCGSITVEDACYYPTQENQLRLYEFPWIKGV